MNTQRKDIVTEEHEIELRARKHMKVKGVKEVIGFDSSYVELLTLCGHMYIDGDGIKIGTLDTDKGVVELEGSIGAVTYSDGEAKEKKSFFGRCR